MTRVSASQGKQGNIAKTIPCQEKHRERFAEIHGKQGFLFTQVKHSPKVKDVVIFIAKLPIYFSETIMSVT